MISVGGHNVANVSREQQFAASITPTLLDINGDERCILDSDPQLLNRRNEKIAVRVPAENAGKEFDQRLSLYATAFVDPLPR
jgi:hypothetical protein